METTLRSRASAIDPRLRLLRTDLLWQARLLGRGRVKETALRLLPLHWLRRPGLPLPPDFGACSGHWYHRLERHLRSKPRSDALKSGERRVASTRGGMYQVADREDRSVQQVPAVAHERPWSPESLRGVQ